VSAIRDPYAFLSPAAAAAGVGLRTPMERSHLAAGAELTDVDGWRVAAYPAADAEAAATATDLSHLGKLDVRGPAAELDSLTGGLATGAARADDGVWTLRLTPTHGYVICPFSRVGALRERIGGPALDVTSAYAAVALGGEARRDVFNRSSGLDVRESRFAADRCMAGSVMRVPTLVLNRGDDLVMLVAWEYGEYFWEAILDAGETIGIARTSVVAAEAPQPEAQEQEQPA
jgi:glycine cleavage system aminomethyltransferase T